MARTFKVHPEFQEHTAQLQQTLEDFGSEGEVLVETGRNRIRRIRIGGEDLVVKRFKTPGLLQGLVYRFLRKSKARRSYEYAKRLLELGIGTPQPVAFAERFAPGLKESFYVCEHLDYDLDFRVLNHNPDYPDRQGILRAVARFTWKLHEKGVHFLDHSPGNTLIKKDRQGRYHCYLIDLNRMRFERLTFKQRLRNFRRLWPSKTMLRILAEEYAELSGHTFEETHRWMSYYARKFMRKANAKKLRRRGGRNSGR